MHVRKRLGEEMRLRERALAFGILLMQAVKSRRSIRHYYCPTSCHASIIERQACAYQICWRMDANELMSGKRFASPTVNLYAPGPVEWLTFQSPKTLQTRLCGRMLRGRRRCAVTSRHVDQDAAGSARGCCASVSVTRTLA